MQNAEFFHFSGKMTTKSITLIMAHSNLL